MPSDNEDEDENLLGDDGPAKEEKQELFGEATFGKNYEVEDKNMVTFGKDYTNANDDVSASLDLFNQAPNNKNDLRDS